MQVPVPAFNDHIHDYHLKILRSFDNREYRFYLLNWHRRARKTTLAINVLIKEAVLNKDCVYGYIAPTYKQAKSIVWRDPHMLNMYLPMDYVRKRNESELYIEFNSGSKLVILGADDPDSVRGIDLEGVVLDEWALMKPMIWNEILRPVITQSKDRWAIFTFTPKGQNHVYDQWCGIDDMEDAREWGRSLLPASKSGLLPGEELIKAKAEMPDSLYEQEFECNFLSDDDNILITSQMIEALRGAHPQINVNSGKVLAIDPSEGGDECVMQVFDNYESTDNRYLFEKDTMKIVGEAMILAQKHDVDVIAVDCIGVGKGVADRLEELCQGTKRRVEYIHSAEKATDSTRFYNRRAEMWWTAMEMIRDKRVPFPSDPEVRKQLSSVKYIVCSSNGKVKLNSKELTRKELGRSPDRADAWIYGIWASLTTPKSRPVDRYEVKEQRRYTFNAMTA
jgi:hypothetical protein